MNIVILAAGQGKRMHSDRPKVLHELAGRPLLAHVVETARALGPDRICVVYGHGGEAVREAIGEDGLQWALQNPQLGTGHAVQQALPLLGKQGPTLVLYGDVPLISADSLRPLVEAARDGIGLLTVEMDDPTGYGRIVREGGAVRRIVEHKDATPEQRQLREVNTGIMAVPTDRLAAWLAALRNDNAQGEYYLTDIIAQAVAEGLPVRAFQPTAAAETLGVNSKTQLAELERIYQRNRAAALLEQGVTLADPGRFDVRGTLRCGRDVYIDVNCVFEGEVVLGDRVSIGPNCVLRDVRIAADTRIEAYCHFDSADIGSNCRIGPYARLRPGTQLAEAVHVGNFCEVKASTIGAYSKANHLSYIGDSEVGRNVNVGAGTITCNYDGANKHRTVIEDDVFIGSDSQLIAPVRVRRGATLGAGTTLTKEAPEGQLTLSRARQVSIASWQRPTKTSK
ncbi:MAG TPA: bifunctional UDP-N-acetylglucosamine diphosphorylase/glucosamine-1-phosphate N-acetyltransferase GlmU [Burkholderiales bacterium]|nr:bifunctional UDP-N-acetylglucosamine diphosphorylase/glucosamine-1-phosphate N-acetyltransferase GlmU [Burkholderiales bacterium]